MDWGVGHLTVVIGMGGGAFANESSLQGWAFAHFFWCSGICSGGARGWNWLAYKVYTGFTISAGNNVQADVVFAVKN